MKKIFSQINRPARAVFIVGWAIVILMIAASTVLYIGAGELFDYYRAVDISEKLLAYARPVSLAVCIASLGIEYSCRKQADRF